MPSIPRAVLTASQATDIFTRKILLESQDNTVSCLKGASVSISKMYKVSAKTIRDIWNRKTWACATSHLWHLTRESRQYSEVIHIKDFCRVEH